MVVMVLVYWIFCLYFITAKRHARYGVWDNIELVPNIILNPGFSESAESEEAHYTRTILFGRTGAIGCPRIIATRANGSRYTDDDGEFGTSDTSSRSSATSISSDHEPKMQKFKRKLSVFFTDPTIKRIWGCLNLWKLKMVEMLLMDHLKRMQNNKLWNIVNGKCWKTTLHCIIFCLI